MKELSERSERAFEAEQQALQEQHCHKHNYALVHRGLGAAPEMGPPCGDSIVRRHDAPRHIVEVLQAP